MSSSAGFGNVAQQVVGMGQIVVGRGETRLSAILGSCVGVALCQVGMKLGAMAHVVLPDSSGRDACPGKFADSAIPAMVASLREVGARPTALVAKIVGGAGMFGVDGPLQIGVANIRAVVAVLDAVGIPIVARDIGGNSGRRAVLDCNSGKIIVTTAAGPTRIL
ncbi:MAG: chemotaxis protein CheD [Thermoguttaceae bacterium]